MVLWTTRCVRIAAWLTYAVMRDRLFRWSAVMVVAAVVTGCSPSDESVSPDVSVSATGSPVATSTATEPVSEPSTPPADPTAALEAEITAFFEEYIATVNASWTSADALARRRQMFSDSCTDCLAGFSFAERAATERLILESDPLLFRRSSIASSSDESILVEVTEDSPPGVLRSASGDLIQEFDEKIGLKILFEVVRRPNEGLLIVGSEVL